MIEPGTADRLGAEAVDGGVNFAVYSPRATRLELCLFDQRTGETRVDLPTVTDGIWHGFVPGVAPGQSYGYRAHGAYDSESGQRFNPAKLLMDPYARELSGAFRWADAVFDHERGGSTESLQADFRDSAPFVPKSMVSNPLTRRATHSRVPWSDTLLYELNVRGFTMKHPAIDEQQRGRLNALGSRAVIEHLRALGVTSVELMPIHAFIDEEFLTRRRLRNFWGYNSISFFAIAARYLGPDGLVGVRRAIDELHEAGIEVILDVVYNHTAEGGPDGPTLSYRGLANEAYYRLLPHNLSVYVNDTGCGNTLNTCEPAVRRLIVDSLTYFTEAFGVDGFRFDLATTLARTTQGFDSGHPLFDEIRRHPALACAKLIAEPWDVGPGGYRLGGFPASWGEWNDQFRDTARRYWCGHQGIAPDLARRIHGSADIFEAGGRAPASSINFVTSHDGFTLIDVVSYVDRHNEANGEANRDGHRHNYSTNHGVEGASHDPVIVAARRRHRLNLLATLLFSQGTPMLLAGDEFGNSQSGNNNAYAQDNETGWLDWSGLGQDPAFFAEVCSLSGIRRELELLRQPVYRHSEPATTTGHPAVFWFDVDGLPMPPESWVSNGYFGLLLSARDAPAGAPMRIHAAAILFNPCDTDLTVRLPTIHSAGRWTPRYSTAGDVAASAVSAAQLIVRAASICCLTHSAENGVA